MQWVKRNLFFVIGAAVAVVLIVLAVVNLIGKLNRDRLATEELEQQWHTLKGYYDMNPFPSQENLNAMRGDVNRLRRFMADGRPLFTPVKATLYNNPQQFKTALDNMVAQLNASAKKAGVILPPQFYYGFQGQAHQLNFSLGGMRTMSHQMAEIQKFCEILFEAKINRLESVARARAGVDDDNPAVSTAELTDENIRTNRLGAVYPYRLTFRCFSGELAAVMEGFANSPHGFLVKAVEVEAVPLDAPPVFDPGMIPPPGSPPPGFPPPGIRPPRTFLPPRTLPGGGGGGGAVPPGYQPQPGGGRQPGGQFPPDGGGRGPGGRGGGGGGRGGRGAVEPGGMKDLLELHQPQAVLAAAGFPGGFPGMAGAGGGRTNRPGLVTILNEKPFRVTLYIESIVLYGAPAARN
ncbi:MAG: Amuc_1100 family pilus-like protein [Verrucomicrobiae bacterium]|nr:Amuc_1100 family pilus-like protein [Verrucomicrobiae bacterium]